MRVLFVAPNIPVPGTHGGSTHVTEVVRALRLEHQVLVLARRGSTGNQVVGIGGILLPGLLRYLLPLKHFYPSYIAARSFKPDVIYERFSACGLGVILAKALGIPVVSMVLDKSATLTTYVGANRLITTAPHLVPERFKDKVEEVSWGANTEVFHPDNDGSSAKEKLGIKNDDFIIGYIGAFYPWHGLETLVDAALMLKSNPLAANFKYLLVGDGKTRNKVLRRIKKYGLSDQFILPGKVPYANISQYHAVCDICAAPYDPGKHHELRRRGMFFDPLKVFESLAAGKATITLDSANMRRMFKDGKHAMLVKPGEPSRLAETILKVGTDADLRLRLAIEGRRLVKEKYSWQAHSQQLSAIFRQLTELQEAGLAK